MSALCAHYARTMRALTSRTIFPCTSAASTLASGSSRRAWTAWTPAPLEPPPRESPPRPPPR
eukprot:13068288-Alexandrium_andersonii.AAC.1